MVACFPAGANAIRQGRLFNLRQTADLAAIVNQAVGGASVLCPNILLNALMQCPVAKRQGVQSGTCCCRRCSDRWLAGAQQDVVQTGAASLGAMNQHIVALGQATPSPAALHSLAQVLAAGQTVLSQAATQLATGAVRPTAWAASYGPSALPDIYSKAKARMYST